MASAPRDVPTPEEERDLHRRLMEGDPTAPPDIVSAFLDPLIAWLQRTRKLPNAEHPCIQAAEDAVLTLIKNPGSYQPNRGLALFSYLKMSASGDLANSQRTEVRRNARTVSLEAVALSPDAGKYLGRDDDPSVQLELSEEVQCANDEVVALLRDGLSPQESAAFDLLLQGERKTAAFAKALEIEHLPKNEQQAIVKRFKDRFHNRIKRGQRDRGKSS